MSKRIVVIGGDGVGPEVTDVACHILLSGLRPSYSHGESKGIT